MDEHKSLEVTALFINTFGTESGQKCLEHLKRVFVDRPIARDGMDLLTIGMRQGEANVIRKIIEEVENGNQRTTVDPE